MNTTTEEAPCKALYTPTNFKYTLRCLMLVMSVILTSESFLTIFINRVSERIREKASTKLVTNLAVSGTLIGLLITLYSIVRLAKEVSKSQIHLLHFVLLMVLPRYLLIVSALCLCCLTLDRYVAICFPLRYHEILTPFRCRFLTVVSWVMPAVVLGAAGALPEILNTCPDPRPFLIIYLVLYTAVTFAVMVMYGLMAREFRGQASDIPKVLKDDARRVRHKTARDVVIIVALNLFLSFPDVAVTLVYLVTTHQSSNWTHLLLLLHQVLFFPVYAWKNADFRTAFLDRCAALRNSCGSSSSSSKGSGP